MYREKEFEMRKAINFKAFSLVVFAILLAPLVTIANASEHVLQVDVERKINLDVTIKPRVLSFSFVKNLYSHNETLNLHVVVVPELQKKTARACRGMACILQTQVTDKMDGTPSIPKAEAMGHFKADTEDFVNFTRRFRPKAKIVVIEKTDGGADAPARLKKDGYQPWGRAKTVSSGGRQYKLSEWVKAVPKIDKSTYGKASGRVKIRSDAGIDFEQTVFVGKFEATAPTAFNLENVPTDSARRQRAIELFGEFRNRVTERYLTIMDKLNTKRQLLNRKDLAILRGKMPGEGHSFNKKIILDWFGERRTVNVKIVASVSVAGSADDSDSRQVNFFEDNEDGAFSPDFENDPTPLPPTGLRLEP